MNPRCRWRLLRRRAREILPISAKNSKEAINLRRAPGGCFRARFRAFLPAARTVRAATLARSVPLCQARPAARTLGKDCGTGVTRMPWPRCRLVRACAARARCDLALRLAVAAARGMLWPCALARR